jgi:hypothetical protein
MSRIFDVASLREWQEVEYGASATMMPQKHCAFERIYPTIVEQYC